jgi:hypothetical protein
MGKPQDASRRSCSGRARRLCVRPHSLLVGLHVAVGGSQKREIILPNSIDIGMVGAEHPRTESHSPAGEAFPLGHGHRRRLDPVRGIAEREEARQFAVEPAGEVAHRGVDADQRGLGEASSPEVFHEGLGDRDEPLLRPVVTIQLLIAGEETVEVAALGIEGGLGLASDFDRGWNVMQFFHRFFLCHNPDLLEERQAFLAILSSRCCALPSVLIVP